MVSNIGYILDLSGILRSGLDYSAGGYHITREVAGELKSEPSKTAVDEAIRGGNIRVVGYSQSSRESVRCAASKTGDINSLSDADLSVLAAALEHNLTIISDDYAIQNTALKLGLGFSTTSHKGIEEGIEWVWVCGGCGRRLEGPGVCSLCGHKGVRRKS